MSSAWSTTVVVALIAYVTGYQVGFGPISWTMVSEVFPLQVRSRALSLAATLNFGLNFVVTVINGPLSSIPNGQAIIFGVYAVLCVAALVFVYFCVPETKGKRLEEIDAMMRVPYNC